MHCYKKFYKYFATTITQIFRGGERDRVRLLGSLSSPLRLPHHAHRGREEQSRPHLLRRGNAGAADGGGLGGSRHSLPSPQGKHKDQLVRHLPAVQLLLRADLRLPHRLFRRRRRLYNLDLDVGRQAVPTALIAPRLRRRRNEILLFIHGCVNVFACLWI